MTDPFFNVCYDDLPEKIGSLRDERNRRRRSGCAQNHQTKLARPEGHALAVDQKKTS